MGAETNWIMVAISGAALVLCMVCSQYVYVYRPPIDSRRTVFTIAAMFVLTAIQFVILLNFLIPIF